MNATKQYMSQKDLRKMQSIQLEMLLEVHRICKKHNIKYSIIAGTFLGAVRHGGYIPWDDDADIAMLRDEYERFCKVCESELDSSKFYLQTHVNTSGYRWGYGKIRRKGTAFVRSGQEHMPYPTGVFIDIFPLDHVPENYILRWIHNGACTVVRKMLWAPVGKKTDKKASIRCIYRLVDLIPERVIFGIYDVLKMISNRKESKLVRILTFPTPNNGVYGYYKKWYTELEEIEFEGYKFPGPKDYDGYLTFKFKNYQQLPHVEERKVHQASFYDLSLTYKE